jgi:hypothetical protein
MKIFSDIAKWRCSTINSIIMVISAAEELIMEVAHKEGARER